MDIKNNICEKRCKQTIKKNLSRDVKECLLSEELSNFERLMVNINNNLVHKSNKCGEIGRALYDQRNLPVHIDRTFTTFGLSKKDPCSCSDVIHGEYINYLTQDDRFIQTHLPGRQKNRGYKYPFSKETVQGKPTNADIQGNKANKLIYSFEKDLHLKDINNFQSKSYLHTFYSIPKDIQISNSSNIDEILRQAPINWKIGEMKKSIGHINALRLRLKKRNFLVSFMDLYTHFSCIDKDHSCTVSLDAFYRILKEVNINPDTKMFEFVLKEFNLITENSSVYYVEALNLLNWKCDFSTLFKIYVWPKELQCYTTTYQDSMSAYQKN